MLRARHGSSWRGQAIINEALCAEHSLGRWLWRGERQGTLLAWDAQVVNTCPENFVSAGTTKTYGLLVNFHETHCFLEKS